MPIKFTVSGLDAEIGCWDKLRSFNSNAIVVEIESMIISSGELKVGVNIKKNNTVTITRKYEEAAFQTMIDQMCEDHIVEHCPKNESVANSENYRVMKQLRTLVNTKRLLPKL